MKFFFLITQYLFILNSKVGAGSSEFRKRVKKPGGFMEIYSINKEKG